MGATLLPGLGTYEFRITTSNPEAQRWFNQAFMLTYGFNHDAAERSYLKAAQLDPDCAMCWWGAALVLGPHVNAQMDPTNNAKAWQRLQRAVALAPKTTDREKAFIHALEARVMRPTRRRTGARWTRLMRSPLANWWRSFRTTSMPRYFTPRR